MSENNTFRLMMGVLAVLAIGFLITYIVNNLDSLKLLIDDVVSKRAIKY